MCLKLEKKLDLFSQLLPASQLVALRHDNLDKRFCVITLFFTMTLCAYVEYVCEYCRYIARTWSKSFFVWIIVWAILFHYFLFFWTITTIQSRNICVACVIFGTISLPYSACEIWHFVISLTLDMHYIAPFALVNFLLQQLFATPILKNR